MASRTASADAGDLDRETWGTADMRRLDIGLNPLRDRTRVVRAPLAGNEIVDVASDHKRGRVGERIEKRRLKVRHDKRIERRQVPGPGDRLTTKAPQSLVKTQIQIGDPRSETAPVPQHVCEAEINTLDRMTLDDPAKI